MENIKKAVALCEFLNRGDITENDFSSYDENLFETDEGDYLVLTDEQADEKTEEYIQESLWAFNIDFLRGFLPDSVQDEAETILKPLQEKCENENDAVKGLINWEQNKKEIVEEAIRWDGRGHFLSSYDGNEHEIKINDEWVYIYRVN